MLLTLPIILAGPLLGAFASLISAAGAAGLVLMLAIGGGGWSSSVALALFAIGATAISMQVLYWPIRTVAHWAFEYYQRSTALLEETREHRAELVRVVADLAHANAQLARLNALTQGLRYEAEEARAAKEQFAANVSHELRTPLNMIVGFTETMLQTPETYGERIPPALMADLVVIQRNAAHLAKLIDDVLDLSQIDAEQMALTKETVDFRALVLDAVSAVRPLYLSKGLYLTADVVASLPPVVCDGTRVREILLNLLSNAGRFTEQGGVHVWVRHDGDDVAVAVADTGPGIIPQDVNRLFVPFQQLNGSVRRRYGGTGLGLAISKRFVEIHGGKIWVESQPGVGTTFHFRLPLIETRTSSRDYMRGIVPDWEYLGRSRPSLAPKPSTEPRFVVVEAGDVLARLLNRYLPSAEVVSVSTIGEAVASASTDPFQALIVNVPSLARGLEEVETAPLPEGIPAIVCSVLGSSDAACQSGASARLVKPVSGKDLLDALERVGAVKGTVLIVDDEPDALQLFGRMLASSARGYSVLIARDGQEALDLMRDRLPDAIILDLVMPNMGGFALLNALRETPRLSGIPAVVVSALDPRGQPIASSGLAVTRLGGLSAHRLLMSIFALIQLLSAQGSAGVPWLPVEPNE
jgi:signal transduction histidine kinase/CheY-like chemotaxis protein